MDGNFNNKYLEDIKSRKGRKNIYSYAHQVVDETTKYIDDVGKFKMWLGIVKRVGAGQLAAKLKYMKERGIKDKKYLMAMCRNDKR